MLVGKALVIPGHGSQRLRGLGWILSVAWLVSNGCVGSQISAPRDPRQVEAERLIDEALAAKDPNKAFALMSRAAELGNPDAMSNLATYFELGRGTEADPGRARALWEQAIAMGSIAAQLGLGMQLLESDVPEDTSRAVSLMRAAYESPPDDEGRDQVRGIAAGGLAQAYLFGIGVEVDEDQAGQYLRKAEESGAISPPVAYRIARAYASGLAGYETNPRRAYRYYRESAEGGIVPAQWNLGMLTLEGIGTKADPMAAYEWVRRAAEAGYPQAEISLAVMLALGQGVPEDDEAARSWYERGVARNSAHALRGYGGMLFTGEGGPVERARGFAYLRLAAEAGEENAQYQLKTVGGAISESDRSVADGIFDDWVRQHGLPGLIE